MRRLSASACLAAPSMVLLAMLGAHEARGQNPADLSPEAAAQIQAVLEEKTTWTASQRKMDSNIIFEMKRRRGETFARGKVTDVHVKLAEAADGRVIVDIVTAPDAVDVVDAVRSAGGEVISWLPRYRALRAAVPYDQLEKIAGSSQVVSIGPKQEYMTNRGAAVGPLYPGFGVRASRVRSAITGFLPQLGGRTPQIGSKMSEGDATHLAGSARSTYGVDGTGVKIGVLSNGVVNLAASQALGDLGTVTVIPGQTGTGDEGTAMLEIIHDIAPGAQLFFATANGGQAVFASNILALRAAGCDIIVDDVFYFAETVFQDGGTGNGAILDAVNTVTASGALYFSSAGNSGNKNDGTSGTWEGDFLSGGAIGGPIAAAGETGLVHDFGGQTYTALTLASASTTTTLSWADPLGASSNDYDVFLLNSTGTTLKAFSAAVQNGTQDPLEIMQTTHLVGDRLVIVLFAGANRFLHLSTNRNQLSISTAGTTSGHCTAANGYAVAATPAVGPFPNPFTTANVVETFSSDGPRRIFFNANGTAITPGNFSSTGGLLRQKPDITAADGVTVTGVGSFPSPFFGTSAAAPHAAAIAALIKQYQPLATPAQIRTALQSTALDIEGAGVDRDSGSGIIMANLALASFNVPTPANRCFIDTTQTDFQGGFLSNVDAVTSPGDLVMSSPFLDQQNASVGNNGTAMTTTTWAGQTFTPAVSGTLAKVELDLFCSACSGAVQNITVGLRATSGGLPTGADIATATIPGFLSGAGIYYTATFAAPPAVVAGTQYALVMRPVVNPTGTYAVIRSGTAALGADVYAGGARLSGATSGTVWSIPLTGGVSTDIGFRAYITGYISGTYESTLKDSNPGPGTVPTWPTLSWGAVLPANTSLQFQAAASNSVTGPFNYVGPSGTAATFYTSPGSLTQFNGNRYLKYKAFFGTTAGATPTLNDVTICTCDAPTTPTITPGGPTTFCAGGSVTLTSSAASGNQWYLNGNPIGGATNPTLVVTATGSYTVTATASGCASAPSAATTVTVNPIPPTPTVTPGGPTTFCSGSSVTLTSSSASGNQWYLNGNPIGGATNQTYVATASGSYTVIVTLLGCSSAASAATTVTVVSNDLSLNKSAAPGPVVAGGLLIYTTTASNAGPTATNGTVTLTDAVPAGTRFVALTAPAGWACTTPAVGAIGAVTCTKASMALAETGVFTLQVRVCADDACPSTINASATIAATCDPNAANNTATAATAVTTQADLAIAMTHAPEPAGAGANVTYTVTVSNAGPSVDANPVVTTTLPAGWTVVSATPTQGTCTPGAGTATCNLGPLGASNQCATSLPTTATITVVANVPLATSAGAYVTTASVVSGACLADPTPANNTVTNNTQVVLLADVKVTKTATPSPVAANGVISYTVTVTNLGPSQASTVTLLDTPQNNLRFVSYRVPAGWSCMAPYPGARGNISCTAPSPLNPGTYVIGIDLRAPAVCDLPLTVRNDVTVSTATSDPDFTNNYATVNDLVVAKPCFLRPEGPSVTKDEYTKPENAQDR